MSLILDTHAALWWLSDDSRLSPLAAEHIAGSRTPPVVSAVSVWEVAIKTAIGKLTGERLLDLAAEAGLEILPMSGEHAQAAGELPPHHSDPFDRVLVAQAQLEGLVLVSRDRRLTAYDVPVLW